MALGNCIVLVLLIAIKIIEGASTTSSNSTKVPVITTVRTTTINSSRAPIITTVKTTTVKRHQSSSTTTAPKLRQAATKNDTWTGDTFHPYRDCLGASLRNGTISGRLEQELFNDTWSIDDKCFDKSTTKVVQNCVLDSTDLEIDAFGPQGPLKDCPACQKIAKSMQNMYFDSKDEQRQCLQKQLIDVISEQTTECLTKRVKDLSNMTAVDFFDFSNSTFKWKEIEMKILNLRVLINNRLDMCSIVNTNRSQNTKACLNRMTEKGDLFKEHCKAIGKCKNESVPKQHQIKFTEINTALCQCYNEKREEWHSKADEVYDAIFDATESEDCTMHVSNAFGIWKQRFEYAMNTCVLTDKPPISLNKMIELGCIQVQSMDDTQKRGLLSGFRFLRNLLDALSDHVMRFCRTCQ